MAERKGANEYEAFPNFLGADPFPSHSTTRPISAISDVTSAYETAASERSTTASPSLTGPVGEPGEFPSRPTTAVQNSADQAGRAPISAHGQQRRIQAQFGRREDPMFIPGSRPTSSLGRNHVPSITAQGFYRPMSPAALQAQRAQNASPTPGTNPYPSRVASPTPEEAEEGDPQRRHRYSNASVNTMRDGAQQGRIEDVPPLPSSRAASDFVYASDHDGPASVASKNSTTPLRSIRPDPRKSNLAAGGVTSPTPPPKSSMSFRASFGLGSRRSSRRDLPENKFPSGHEKLPSNPASPVEYSSSKPLPVTPARRNNKHKNYEYFAGNTIFFSSGMFLNTRAAPLNVLTFTLVVIPAALFFAASAPWLWYNVSPALPLIFGYFFFLTLSSFLHAAFSDPGILPRNLHPHPPNPEEENNPLAIGPPTTDWVMVRSFPRLPSEKTSPSDAASAENGATTAMEVPVKFCKSCQIWRPPRCHHCRICDFCVEGHDHHCVWLNQCVGKRNYRFFFAFVGWSAFMALVLIAFALTHIAIYANRNDVSFGTALSGRWQERMAFAAFVYAVLAMPYPGSLFVYHVFLMSRGETTREYLNTHKFAVKDRHRPYAMPSFWKNLSVALSRPRGPSYMEFKRRYVEGDVRLGYLKPASERQRDEVNEKVARESRVKDMMKRLSVIGHSTNGADQATDNPSDPSSVEMKSLPAAPPLPPLKNAQNFGRKGSNPGLKGYVNNTPR